jgi:hypothetical protein
MKRPICCLRQFITAHPRHPVYKTPPPFSHKFRNFRVAFLHLAFISRTSCQCTIARVRRHGSAVRESTQESKTPSSLPSSEQIWVTRPLIDRRTTPQDFRSVQLPDPQLGGEECVSSLLSAAVRCLLRTCPLSLLGLFGRISTTRERTRSPDTHAPRLSLIYFGVPRGACLALPCLGTRLARSLQTSVRSVSRTNERTNERTNLELLDASASSVPTSLVRYFCLEISCRRCKILRKSPHTAVSFPSLPLASPRLESPPPCNRSWLFEANRDLHERLASLNNNAHTIYRVELLFK